MTSRQAMGAIAAGRTLGRREDSLFLKRICFLAGVFLFYGKNDGIDLVIIAAILFVGATIPKFEMFCSLYFLLLYFEGISVLPFVGGSLFLVFEAILLIRYFTRHRGSVYVMKNYWIPVVVCVAMLYSSSAVGQSVKVILSPVINSAMLLLIIPFIRNNYRYAFAVISISAVANGLYGLIHQMTIPYGAFARYSGAAGDPTYSAYLYTVGICAAIGCSLFSRRQKRLLIGVLCGLILLTVSITGLLVLLALGGFYLFQKRISWGIAFFVGLGLLSVIFIGLPIESGPLMGIHRRVLSILNALAQGEVGAATSGRTDLLDIYTDYFWEGSFFQILFGGRSSVDMVDVVGLASHSAYVDALFAIGIVGVVLLVGLVLFHIVAELRRYFREGNPEALSVALIKLAVLAYMCSISIFPNRYWHGLMFL